MSADIQVTEGEGGTTAPESFEVSLAPRAGDLLSLPFDQYGRMVVVQNIVDSLYTQFTGVEEGAVQGARVRVLDVGGYPGVLRNFLSTDRYDLTVLDVPPDDGSIPGYVQGSGMELPFGDGEFDIVTSLDTLEHIPAAERGRFLSEVSRVARHAAVLVNPVQSLEADLAEETLNEYISWILDAQQEQLAEHRSYGLPDLDATEMHFREQGWTTLRFPLANIYNWLFMMIAKHFLISMRDEKASAFERSLDRFYNLTFSAADRTEPAYRGVLVAVKQGAEAVLDTVATTYPPLDEQASGNAMRLQLAQVLMSMLNLKVANHEDKLLREQMERRDKHNAALEAKVAIQDLEIDRRNVEIERLSAHINSLGNQMAELQAEMDRDRAELVAEFSKHERYIATLEQEVRNKDEHILYLERLLAGIQSGRVMRVTRAISRFVGRH